MMLNVLLQNCLVKRFSTAKFPFSLLESPSLRPREQRLLPAAVRELVVGRVENVVILDVVVVMVVDVDVVDVQVVVDAAYVSIPLFLPSANSNFLIASEQFRWPNQRSRKFRAAQ